MTTVLEIAETAKSSQINWLLEKRGGEGGGAEGQRGAESLFGGCMNPEHAGR